MALHLTNDLVLFFKTSPPVQPVDFVTSFCEAAAKPGQRRQTRSVRRLTPISLIGKATSDQGIEDVAKIVLAPHFHTEGQETRKVRTYFSVGQDLFRILIEYLQWC
jgi:tRNA acetyltransferase TAN1